MRLIISTSSCSGGQSLILATPSASNSASCRTTSSGVPTIQSFGNASSAADDETKSPPRNLWTRSARSSSSDRSRPQTTPARIESSSVTGSRPRRVHAPVSAARCSAIWPGAPAATLYSSAHRAARSRLRRPPPPPRISLGRSSCGFGRASLSARLAGTPGTADDVLAAESRGRRDRPSDPRRKSAEPAASVVEKNSASHVRNGTPPP